MFFSQLPDNYEESFWEEIWGCVNYIKLPYETVMSMPVQNRRIWIQKHNLEHEKKSMAMTNSDGSLISGEAMNAYAELEMKKAENAR